MRAGARRRHEAEQNIFEFESGTFVMAECKQSQASRAHDFDELMKKFESDCSDPSTEVEVDVNGQSPIRNFGSNISILCEAVISPVSLKERGLCSDVPTIILNPILSPTMSE